MATLAELRALVRSILREPVPARWSNADIDRYINAGVLEIARAMERRKSATVAVVPGTSVLTRMPCGASSSAICRISPCTPDFAAV